MNNGRINTQDKIKDLDELAGILGSLGTRGRKIVHCHGVFDLLHIGHIRHFQQAKDLGDVLGNPARRPKVIAACDLEGTDPQVMQQLLDFAEGGGQVGDAGEIFSSEGRVVVTDTQAPIAGLIVHKGRVAEGTVSVGDAVTARVDAHRRLSPGDRI